MAGRPTPQALLKAEVLVGQLVRSRPGDAFDVVSLHRSYGVAAPRLREIISRNGGIANG